MAVFQDNISKSATDDCLKHWPNETSSIFSDFYGRTPNNSC